MSPDCRAAEADHGCAAVPGLELTSELSAATCFRDRLPGTDRRLVAAGSLPLLRYLKGSGGWNRTNGLHDQRCAWVPGARRHYQHQLPRIASSWQTSMSLSKFGEKDLNLHSLVQSQAAYR